MCLGPSYLHLRHGDAEGHDVNHSVAGEEGWPQVLEWQRPSLVVNLCPEEDEQGVGREVDLSGEEEGRVVEERPVRRVGDVHQPLVREDEEERPPGKKAHDVQKMKDLLSGPPILWQAQLNAYQLDLLL